LAYQEKQNQKQMKFTKPLMSPTTTKRGRLLNETESERSRIMSASPISGMTKLDRIAAAQQRMLAKQSGVQEPDQGQSLKKIKSQERQMSESMMAEQMLTSQFEAIPHNIRSDPKKYFQYMSNFYNQNAKSLYRQDSNKFTSPLRQSLIEHRPFDTKNDFRPNEKYHVQSKFGNVGSYVNGLREQAEKLKYSIRGEKDLKTNRWPYILGDSIQKPNDEPKPVFDRLVRDSD
jgi:hypothetical protein